MSEQPVDEVVMVPNPYLAALRDNRSDALPHTYALRTAFDDAISAMDQGAWFSTEADRFYAELSQRPTELSRVRDNAIGTFDDAMSGMPQMVEADSPYTRWQNLSGW